MDIKGLLEYAKIDGEMTKLYAAFNEEPAVKEYNAQKKRYTDAQELIVKLNADAEDIIKQINAMNERYQECLAQLKEYQTTAGEIEDENEADFYSKNVEKLLSNLSSLGTDIAALSKTVADIRKQAAKASTDASDATMRTKAVLDAYNNAKKEYAPRINDIKTRLAKAGEGMGEGLAVYQDLRKRKVKHPMVTLNGSNCGGCFMDLDGTTREKIETQGYVLCPSCHRIIYKAE